MKIEATRKAVITGLKNELNNYNLKWHFKHGGFTKKTDEIIYIFYLIFTKEGNRVFIEP